MWKQKGTQSGCCTLKSVGKKKKIKIHELHAGEKLLVSCEQWAMLKRSALMQLGWLFKVRTGWCSDDKRNKMKNSLQMTSTTSLRVAELGETNPIGPLRFDWRMVLPIPLPRFPFPFLRCS